MDSRGKEIRQEILVALASNPGMGFNDLLKHIREDKPRTSPRRLTKVLKALVDEGRVGRTIDDTWPPSSQYSIIPNIDGGLPRRNKVLELDKFCPVCVEARLRARITAQTITMKCKNPRCPVGGGLDDSDDPPFYLRGANPSPRWEEKGLDLFDLVHLMVASKRKKWASEYWSDTCTNCNKSDIEIVRSGPYFSKECQDCGHSPGGIVTTGWSTKEGIAFLRNHTKVRDGWVTKPVKVDDTICWSVTHHDLEKDHRLTLYAEHKTFRPVRLVIDYEPKPIDDEKTAGQLAGEMIA